METLDIKVLQKALNVIESYIPQGERIKPNVSKADVSWHLDHSLKVINAVVTTMQNSDPALYEDNFSFIGKLLLKFRFFPRGKAKAPKYVTPPEVILEANIKLQLTEVRALIKTLSRLDDNAYFKHPLFGNINTSRVVPFLEAHTNHHLKIVKCILK
ncbi:DUF1569 domain-containing protein [Winogradskyella psychrotolerans]|uniref:DUF1569 domain-containing protein n=1 Tax=Winogradskyella psychrotolerans TaxID=1344585 RepID=UPI001C06680D|nr:DUF1569 domain-containing protein [Winogradskyella psychrotolerans]MBU2928037.1 DUF1569 domain-containing protein [Winogradskyella psychrotolerans]